jgi:hypothetical protein
MLPPLGGMSAAARAEQPAFAGLGMMKKRAAKDKADTDEDEDEDEDATSHIAIALLVECSPATRAYLDQASAFVTELAALAARGHNQIYLAVVGYRGLLPGETSGGVTTTDFALVDATFASRGRDLQSALLQLAAAGPSGATGGATNVAEGLAALGTLSWRSSYSCALVLHLAIAPPYGRQYHAASIDDPFSEGHPRHGEPLDLIRALRPFGVSYHLWQLDAAATQQLVDKLLQPALDDGRCRLHLHSAVSAASMARDLVAAVAAQIRTSN